MVIRIGEVEWHDLRRSITLAKTGGCEHKRLQYIEHGELLVCLDCEKQVTAVWALKRFFTQYEMAKERLDHQQKELEETLKKSVSHRGALAVQDAWRRLKYVPTCPHCWKAIAPPDGFGRTGMKHKEHYADEILPLVMKPNLTAV